jgi:mannitol/fructose-specific phosphotransferase system IIA component (Ntr-type)
MRVLARLARLVMDENFRAQLESGNDKQKLYGFLKEKLGLE